MSFHTFRAVDCETLQTAVTTLTIILSQSLCDFSFTPNRYQPTPLSAEIINSAFFWEIILGNDFSLLIHRGEEFAETSTHIDGKPCEPCQIIVNRESGNRKLLGGLWDEWLLKLYPWLRLKKSLYIHNIFSHKLSSVVIDEHCPASEKRKLMFHLLFFSYSMSFYWIYFSASRAQFK